jgi:hypothetical protein
LQISSFNLPTMDPPPRVCGIYIHLWVDAAGIFAFTPFDKTPLGPAYRLWGIKMHTVCVAPGGGIPL